MSANEPMTADELLALAAATPGVDAATLAAMRRVRAAAAARSQVERARLELAKLSKKYQDECRTWSELIAAAQRGCPHPDAAHHPDPSGGRDSHHTCTFCGKEF